MDFNTHSRYSLVILLMGHPAVICHTVYWTPCSYVSYCNYGTDTLQLCVMLWDRHPVCVILIIQPDSHNVIEMINPDKIMSETTFQR